MSSPLSAFTAVPNPQMLAFMGAQSYLMMYMAGAGWQFGKRKISAMLNEDFNPLTVTTLYKQMTTELKESIPTIERSMNDMTSLLGPIIEQYGAFIREAIDAIPQTVKNIAHPDSPVGLALEQPDALSSVIKFFKEILPSIPAAEARVGTGQGDRIEDMQTAVSDNEAAIALAKHEERIAAANRIKELEKQRLAKIPAVHQIAIKADRGTSVKRKAGQTQIQRRKALIAYLARTSAELKIQAGSSYPSAKRNIIKLQKRFNNIQTELTGLLLRYRF